ncbi:deoxyribodipyrimidine photo-lyase, partial [Salmonella enterica subsp. enterica serovar Montevideo]
MVSVMWFRRDFRLIDNKALYHALNNSEQLILIFQINPEQFICNSYNHRAFFSSLRHFKEQVDTYAHLQVFWGDPLISFRKLKNKLPEWNSIYFNSDETGYGNI